MSSEIFWIPFLWYIWMTSSSSLFHWPHTKHVKIILANLRRHHLYRKLKECTFEVDTIEFLGKILSPGLIKMDPEKIQTFIDWPVPKSKCMVHQFMGFANFYRRLICGFSSICIPITALTKTGSSFTWTPAAQHAFDHLKELFTQAPVLIQPDVANAFYLERHLRISTWSYPFAENRRERPAPSSSQLAD
ncbi:uncharacterized protein LOC128664604 [Bombina bombina]|uniref:uncharacterized protein LOC128664604 n=1 Tax=Bombina bombina TaxID=8345 RepID=UPI00235A92B7|nr:uncharacterized protein LOC128664604 [Bombina bombina]